ncbi:MULTISPECIES: hypothetical protein [Burkholderia]|uniref:hypothetical protein n=1 Tax=Burkholderia TaxID=32008 RepID=UPI001F607433|nr:MULTISPECIES: hypothetical protein [Burkholderia]MCI3969721.1 hypothetical protein [Burkholderia sp. HI4860]MDN7787818.1 hypothetical protein [Burkholderia contaminans]
MKMRFEYRIHTTPSADVFDAIANALRQAHHAVESIPTDDTLKSAATPAAGR